tara:strand:+ start:5096 stop:6304 length:1209 start_codon:yes stop_codon:yes gene_type:complete
MKKILFLSYYFYPDLSAGSFRNTSLISYIDKLVSESSLNIEMDLITTSPNRYKSFRNKKTDKHNFVNVNVHYIDVGSHNNNFFSQALCFFKYFLGVFRITKKQKYSLVYASSSRLFTASLAVLIKNLQNSPYLYLDIRDIFFETITDVFDKNIVLTNILKLVIPPIEYYTFKNSDHINLVSPGFKDYFNKFKFQKNLNFSFFTNGIDDEFLKTKENSRSKKNIDSVKIIYAGNIGSSQCLDKTLPKIAKNLGDNYKFCIYGDGARKNKLLDEIEFYKLKNISINNPIAREELIIEYENSDILFMQVDDKLAFKRVIPSKLFEYSSFNKPILALIDGYCKTFIEENLSHSYVVGQKNFTDVVKVIKKMDLQKIQKSINRDNFKKKYSRKNINKLMAKSILKHI